MHHPLNRPIWTALTTCQEAIAQVTGGIRRYPPEFGPFAASAEGTTESLTGLAALVPPGGHVCLQHGDEIEAPPGLALLRVLQTVQMVAEQMEEAPTAFMIEVLSPSDAPEMLALAQLTKPGPFAARTHELGRFVGIRHAGRLVAMAGERMKAGPFTEISGVCTHPDHRGKGYAAGLMREVGRAILARNERPFLHAFADNVGAIALYERLGFVTRWNPVMMVLERL